MLIEVTCIKWNLIGTDTGSLTDRHDADGLRERGGGGVSERKRERTQERDSGKANMKLLKGVFRKDVQEFVFNLLELH